MQFKEGSFLLNISPKAPSKVQFGVMALPVVGATWSVDVPVSSRTSGGSR